MALQTQVAIIEALRAKLEGEVLTDQMSRALYSTDASLYQIDPLVVVLPRHDDDVIAAMRLAAEYGIPVLPRGGGTSLAGQTVSPGMVIDFSKYMNSVLEVDPERRLVRVQPGIIMDNLNQQLMRYGLFFAPDVATSSRANIGGMIGNNSSGMRSVRYGKTVDHVRRIRAVLSTGEIIDFGSLDRAALDRKCLQSDREGRIYNEIRELTRSRADAIRERFPQVMRRVSGYNLDELLKEEDFNLARLLVGSEGTLAATLDATLNLEPIPGARLVAVLHFTDLMRAIRTVPVLLQYEPSAVELLDHYGMNLAKQSPSFAQLCGRFIEGDPDAVLIVEFSDQTEQAVRDRFKAMTRDSAVRDHVYAIHEATTAGEQADVWQVRKGTLGVLMRVRGDFKPVAFIEDSCVPVEHLADYVGQIRNICRHFDRQVSLYAHASVGVIHFRPVLNLKKVFDPLGIMNPGKIVDASPPTEHLRIHPGYRVSHPPTFYRFEHEMGFAGAVEMCTGVGQCRKTISGTMCPSYIATRDEEHSTRGRANALRAAVSGRLGPDGFTSDRLYQVLDLCLECKACKSECPTNVDMAKMKAEFLGHYYERHGLPLQKRLVAGTRRSAEFASRWPAFANLVTGAGITRFLLEYFAGFDARRRLPRYAAQTLMQWYWQRAGSPAAGDRPVVTIFADTFSNFYEPSVGRSAFELLKALGFDVHLASPGCCGRPLISAGLLGRAKRNGAALIRKLESIPGPILVLEPSCYSTFKDDYLDLIDDVERTAQVVARIFSLEEFLGQPENAVKLETVFEKSHRHLLFHGHCQQKALIGSEPTLNLLHHLPGVEIEEVPDGCCGMAGSFGYEKGHYELSEKIGSRHLLPAVRAAAPDTRIVVSGFSCRSQIEHFTGRKAIHPVEALAEALR
ncbi:MAG: FAD-binding protein [Acidobacteriota bacterium]